MLKGVIVVYIQNNSSSMASKGALFRDVTGGSGVRSPEDAGATGSAARDGGTWDFVAFSGRQERKRIMIRSILEPEALERLHRIGLVKPEKKEQAV